MLHAHGKAKMCIRDRDWTMRIVDEISTADRLVFQVGLLAQNLARASGDSDGNAQKNMAMEQGYFRLDMPFRRWLEGIDPKRDSINESCARWWEQEKQVIRSLGRELINQASPQAFVGRIKVDERNNRELSLIHIWTKESPLSGLCCWNHRSVAAGSLETETRNAAPPGPCR